MHELSIAVNIVDLASEEAKRLNARRVSFRRARRAFLAAIVTAGATGVLVYKLLRSGGD